MSTEACAFLSRSALNHNLSVIKRLCPKQKIWAMVKGNAYGHGLHLVNELAAVDIYGVATLREAKTALHFRPTARVAVMRGFVHESDALTMARSGIIAVVHSKEQLAILKQLTPLKPLPIWLKIETGMNRLGLWGACAEQFLTEVDTYPVKLMGVMSHFACSDDLDSSATDKQMQYFDDLLGVTSTPQSLANSAAILQHPMSHRDWVRPGLMLYGVSPFANKTGLDLDLQPVMTLKAPVLVTHTLRKGESTGYGHTFKAPSDMPFAVIGLGYGDGYPREPGAASVLIANVLCPVIGRVSMDMMTVDLRPLMGKSIGAGEWATIWGRGNPIELLAQTAGTIPYTLLTRLAQRVDYKWED